MLWNRIAVLLGVWGTAVSMPVELMRRQDPTALTILQVVVLIQEYELQYFCSAWVAEELDTRALPTENEVLRRRQIDVPAVLALYSDAAITAACQQVEDDSTFCGREKVGRPPSGGFRQTGVDVFIQHVNVQIIHGFPGKRTFRRSPLLCTMAPLIQLDDPKAPPTNVAQVGMGWNLLTGTIDLGLGIFDAIILVQEWMYQWGRKKSKELKEMDIQRRGRRNRTETVQKRDLIISDEELSIKWE